MRLGRGSVGTACRNRTILTVAQCAVRQWRLHTRLLLHPDRDAIASRHWMLHAGGCESSSGCLELVFHQHQLSLDGDPSSDLGLWARGQHRKSGPMPLGQPPPSTPRHPFKNRADANAQTHTRATTGALPERVTQMRIEGLPIIAGQHAHTYLHLLLRPLLGGLNDSVADANLRDNKAVNEQRPDVTPNAHAPAATLIRLPVRPHRAGRVVSPRATA